MLDAKFQQAMEALGLDEAMYVEILKDLEKQTAEQLLQIDAALSGGNMDQVRMLAHSIKGASANMRVDTLAEKAKALEDAAKNSQTADVLSRLNGELKVAFEDFCRKLRGG